MQFPFNDGFPLYSISVVDTRQSDERWELSPALSSVSYLVKPNWVINEGYSIERVFLKYVLGQTKSVRLYYQGNCMTLQIYQKSNLFNTYQVIISVQHNKTIAIFFCVIPVIPLCFQCTLRTEITE